ncbi:MAG: TRAM domain-containing protein [Actinomycetota bacterium]|nr:TRAM domain-containing protein [Actinomycetota bacterium]
MLQVIRAIFIITGAIGAYELSNTVQLPPPFSHKIVAFIIYFILGVGIGYVLGGVAGRRLIKALNWFENKIHKLPMSDLLLALIGLLVGLVVAWLVSIPFGYLEIPFLQFSVAIFAFFALGYLGIKISLKRRDDLRSISHMLATSKARGSAAGHFGGGLQKLLDTSVIIDGRIADVAKTGFIEGTIVVPRFVLRELQTIADSEDSLKRNRGRRGLDILRSLQNEPKLHLEILERDYPELADVDSKLVKLASDIGAMVLTNDYNLNKIAELQGVRVLNLNELANSLKPVVLPGEEMFVGLVREGKEIGQGVGYLDDGTMVVVDGGKIHVGEEVEILVTSVLQTPAGRMIFGKMKEQKVT